MKTIYKIFLMTSLIAVTGCIKDSGNYDYTYEYSDQPEGIKILNMSLNPEMPGQQAYVFKQGEEIVIEPKYEIKDKTLTEEHLAFEWIFGGKTVCTERTLKLPPQPAARYSGMITITDTRYDISYNTHFGFQVDPTYVAGWTLLSDNGSVSRLCYLYKDSNGKYCFSDDIYGTANNGAILETGADKLVYHPYVDGSKYGLTVIQPGETGPIDLNAHDMSPFGTMKETFIDGAQDMEFADVVYKKGGFGTSNYVYALDTKGKLYIREEATYNDEIVPMTGKFSGPLVADEAYDVQCLVNNSLFSSMFVNEAYVLGYDRLNKRCFYLHNGVMYPFSKDFYTNGENEPFMPGDPGNDGINEYPDITVAGPEDLEGYDVRKMICCGVDAESWTMNYVPTVVMLVQNTADRKLYLLVYDFYLTESDGTLYTDIDLMMFIEWPEDIPVNPETMITMDNMGGPGKYFFFTGGADNTDIYFYDMELGGSCKKIYTSDNTITSMRRGEAGNAAMMPGPYSGTLVVGTGDGTISVISCDRESLVTGKVEELYKTQTDGRISAIEYMPNDMVSY